LVPFGDSLVKEKSCVTREEKPGDSHTRGNAQDDASIPSESTHPRSGLKESEDVVSILWSGRDLVSY